MDQKLGYLDVIGISEDASPSTIILWVLFGKKVSDPRNCLTLNAIEMEFVHQLVISYLIT